MRATILQAVAVILGYVLTTAALIGVYPWAGMFWAGGWLMAAGLLIDL